MPTVIKNGTKLRERYYVWFFAAIALLVLTQLTWWAWNFLEQVDVVAELRSSNLALHSMLENVSPSEDALRVIERQAERRRLMFISESGFFALLTVWALFLLYRAFRREEQSRRLQKNFIEVVSHESKTPLTALKLRLESLRDPNIDDKERAMEIEGGLEEVRRLISTFEKMLTLHRTERRALFLQPEPLEDVVAAVLRRLGPLLKKNEVEVACVCPAEARVLGDRAGLETSIQCLIENSVLHNPRAGRRIWIEVEPRDRHWLLKIRDNGPGVAQVDREPIFAKFTRGSGPRTVPGTGLGLYIARTIAEAHHGWLRLTASDERGSTFELEIPAVPA